MFGNVPEAEKQLFRMWKSKYQAIGMDCRLHNRVKGGQELEGGELCVRIFVAKKKSLSELTESGVSVIPEAFGMYRTDVVEIGEIVALTTPPIPDPRKGIIPIVGGVSIGHKDVTAGTVARCALYGKDKLPVVISNNHVLANSATVGGTQAKIGDSVYQPGPYDIVNSVGKPITDDLIAARLFKWIPFSEGGVRNKVDVALAVPTGRGWFFENQLGVSLNGKLSEIRDPILGLKCFKSGRTTGFTIGTVFSDSSELSVKYGDRYIEFEDVVILQNDQGVAISAPGDSGSLLIHLDDQGKDHMVGLVFAGSDKATIACKMSNVVDAFEGELSFDGPVGGNPVNWEPPKEEKPKPPTKKGYYPSSWEGFVEITEALEDTKLEVNMDSSVGLRGTLVVKGKLFGNLTGSPISDALVTIRLAEEAALEPKDEVAYSEITDLDGSFAFVVVVDEHRFRPGKWRVTIKFKGRPHG